MSKRKFTDAEFKRISYEIFIWLLTLLSIFNILWVIFSRDPIVIEVITQVNRLISLIFMGDFLFRLHAAPSRRDYFLKRYGWLDLISGFPFLGAQLARVVRFYLTARLISASGEQNIIRQVFQSRANTTVLSVSLFVILLVEFASMAILYTETGAANANIDTATEAMWWVLVTISTVGYGDYFPVTMHGRFVAILVIIAGVAVFGTLSGFLAKIFLGTDPAAEAGRQTLQTILTNMQQLQQEQAELKQIVQADRESLQAQLTAVEQLLKQALAEQDN